MANHYVLLLQRTTCAIVMFDSVMKLKETIQKDLILNKVSIQFWKFSNYFLIDFEQAVSRNNMLSQPNKWGTGQPVVANRNIIHTSRKSYDPNNTQFNNENCFNQNQNQSINPGNNQDIIQEYERALGGMNLEIKKVLFLSIIIV